jgi:hypothetical protein
MISTKRRIVALLVSADMLLYYLFAAAFTALAVLSVGG